MTPTELICKSARLVKAACHVGEPSTSAKVVSPPLDMSHPWHSGFIPRIVGTNSGSNRANACEIPYSWTFGSATALNHTGCFVVAKRIRENVSQPFALARNSSIPCLIVE